MSDANTKVRARFCPSPTGDPHVGMLRTALFNWAFARHNGGTLVFRIEDTDAERDSEESYQALLDSLRWIGIDWDEGPEIGGDFGPYRQSERGAVYQDVLAKLAETSKTYKCYCTADELAAERDLARKEGRVSGYSGRCRDLSDEERAAFEAEGRTHVIRFRMPEQDWIWNDLVRGEMTVAGEQVPDFVLVRPNGDPLYTLVNPVDDAVMEITHVLRGEDLLSSTPRQLALHGALIELGVGSGAMPEFGHLPYVMGEGNKKLSKRDPEASFSHYIDAGFLPEGFVNYLALLGWSPGNDVEFFSREELARDFEISKVNVSPARFDLKKATAINGDWIRALPADVLADRIVPYLVKDGVLSAEPTEQQRSMVRVATPLISERMETLGQASGMLGFLFAGEPGCQPFEIDPEDAAKMLDDEGRAVVTAAMKGLETMQDWSTESIESNLRQTLIDGLELKPRVAFGAVRVAITGRRVSPPLFESMELLGRERSMERLAAVAQ
ncbi:MAG: glutamate--tRNA ligase [Candidatus Nanopelagicales bacterium]